MQISYKVKPNNVEFWIKDSGIGIPERKQKTIFKEFIQADVTHSSGYEGSGLGLSITKGYIDILKGEIDLKSEPEKGTTFHVSLPVGEVRV